VWVGLKTNGTHEACLRSPLTPKGKAARKTQLTLSAAAPFRELKGAGWNWLVMLEYFFQLQ
jgi:hypothetical protein